jgi:FKBP-type peptidyl-prolyl cis-trans isomerase SlyD
LAGVVNTQPSFQVGPGTVVHVSYQLFDAEGELVETSEGELELAFLFGYGQLAPALEQALAGARVGEERRLKLTPRQAFGERDPEQILHVERAEFPPELAVGDEFEAEDESGDSRSLVVLEVTEDTVVLDSNHPLAGQAVTVSLQVEAVRPARGDEISAAEIALESLGFDGESLLPASRLVRPRPGSVS